MFIYLYIFLIGKDMFFYCVRKERKERRIIEKNKG